MKQIKFAPREIFDQILTWGVIPTFDLVINQKKRGVILVKRTIAPYKNQWALPGLRMYKGENIDDTLKRIAKNELGISIKTDHKTIISQFVGKFTSEHNRQDISTGYLINIPADQKIKFNKEHFSDIKFIKNSKEIPSNMGAMYKYYLIKYFKINNVN